MAKKKKKAEKVDVENAPAEKLEEPTKEKKEKKGKGQDDDAHETVTKTMYQEHKEAKQTPDKAPKKSSGGGLFSSFKKKAVVEDPFVLPPGEAAFRQGQMLARLWREQKISGGWKGSSRRRDPLPNISCEDLREKAQIELAHELKQAEQELQEKIAQEAEELAALEAEVQAKRGAREALRIEAEDCIEEVDEDADGVEGEEGAEEAAEGAAEAAAGEAPTQEEDTPKEGDGNSEHSLVGGDKAAGARKAAKPVQAVHRTTGERAVACYREAAASGHAGAQIALGLLYLEQADYTCARYQLDDFARAPKKTEEGIYVIPEERGQEAAPRTKTLTHMVDSSKHRHRSHSHFHLGRTKGLHEEQYTVKIRGGEQVVVAGAVVEEGGGEVYAAEVQRGEVVRRITAVDYPGYRYKRWVRPDSASAIRLLTIGIANARAEAQRARGRVSAAAAAKEEAHAGAKGKKGRFSSFKVKVPHFHKHKECRQADAGDEGDLHGLHYFDHRDWKDDYPPLELKDFGEVYWRIAACYYNHRETAAATRVQQQHRQGSKKRPVSLEPYFAVATTKEQPRPKKSKAQQGRSVRSKGGSSEGWTTVLVPRSLKGGIGAIVPTGAMAPSNYTRMVMRETNGRPTVSRLEMMAEEEAREWAEVLRGLADGPTDLWASRDGPGALQHSPRLAARCVRSAAECGHFLAMCTIGSAIVRGAPLAILKKKADANSGRDSGSASSSASSNTLNGKDSKDGKDGKDGAEVSVEAGLGWLRAALKRSKERSSRTMVWEGEKEVSLPVEISPETVCDSKVDGGTDGGGEDGEEGGGEGRGEGEGEEGSKKDKKKDKKEKKKKGKKGDEGDGEAADGAGANADASADEPQTTEDSSIEVLVPVVSQERSLPLFILGWCFDQGIGVQNNPVLAYDYFAAFLAQQHPAVGRVQGALDVNAFANAGGMVLSEGEVEQLRAAKEGVQRLATAHASGEAALMREKLHNPTVRLSDVEKKMLLREERFFKEKERRKRKLFKKEMVQNRRLWRIRNGEA
jgi:hypothetical protein